MTERSFPWTGTTTGDVGPYAASAFRAWNRMLFCGDAASQAVVPDYLGELAVTAGTDSVTVASGAAIVNGVWYENTAPLTVATEHSDAGTIYYRIVAQEVNATNAASIVAIGGTAAASPTLTQTDGTKWENNLATVAVTTAGAVTVTDERDYLHFNTMAATANLEDSAVTVAKRADRTRSFFVSGAHAQNETDSASLAGGVPYWTMAASKSTVVCETFVWPRDSWDDSSDYTAIDNIAIYPLVQAAASGNISVGASLFQTTQGLSWAFVGPGDGGAGDAMPQYYAPTEITALVANTVTKSASTTPIWGRVGAQLYDDIMTVKYARYGTSASDTLAGSVQFLGWLVTYTADS